MSDKGVQGFADRVKKFYYRRAFLCEQMCDETGAGCRRRISFETEPEDLTPIGWEPLNNLYEDSHVLACAALDGLSFWWQVLEKGSVAKLKSEQRYTQFLLGLNSNKELQLVSTPFLYLSLETQAIEKPFRELIMQRWGGDWGDDSIVHSSTLDPTVDELKLEYDRVSVGQIENIDQTLPRFTYSGLIYKYYRCSFVHQYMGSGNTGGFARGEEMMVYFDTGVQRIKLDESGSVSWIEDLYPRRIPTLDIGLGVLSRAIRKGADFIHRLIVEKNCKEMPRTSTLIWIRAK